MRAGGSFLVACATVLGAVAGVAPTSLGTVETALAADDTTAWVLPTMPAKCSDAQKTSGNVAGCLLDGSGAPEARGWPSPPFPTPEAGPVPTEWVPLQRGDAGSRVTVLQQALVDHGVTTFVDGSFGPATETSVKTFQSTNGLEPTGIVDQATAEMLGILETAIGGPFPPTGWNWLGWGYNKSPALADWETLLVGNTSKFVTNLAEVSPQLTELVSNTNIALGEIADNNESLALALDELPPTLRQGNTTLANLRVALDDVQPMIAASGRAADAGLANYLKNYLRPVLNRARPVFNDLALAAGRPGPNNDTSDLLSQLIPLHPRAEPAVNAVVRALNANQEEVSEMRAYSPDIFSNWSQLAGILAAYDANGPYARVTPTATGVFQLNGTAIQPADTAIYGGLDVITGINRCPGGGVQPIAGSNPFLDNGNLTGKCDPSQVP